LSIADKMPVVRPMRIDIHLALANAQRGVDAVMPHDARIRKELPMVDRAAIASLVDVGLGVAFAGGIVDRYAPSVATDVNPLLARARKVRARLLASADALAVAGLVSPAVVAKIRAGHGGLDAAGDCVALAALFRKNERAVRGKTPVTAADVREASEVGSRLLEVLHPKGAKRARPDDERARATEARDRLWTLFATRWEDLVWRAGAWLFGRDVDAHVPPLHARVAAKRAAKAPAPVTKAPPAATT